MVSQILHFFFSIHKSIFFFRNPVSSGAEAIYVNEKQGLNDFERNVYIKALSSALLAAGFSQNNSEFTLTTCPLGTFRNISTKGAGGCQNCPPGNF